MLIMEADHLRIVHLINMVTGKDQHIVRLIALNKGDVLIDGIRRSLIPLRFFALCVRRQNLHTAMGTVQPPRLAVADILIQFQRLILGQNTHSIDLGVDTVGKRKIDDSVLSAEGNCRFRRILSQNHQAASLPASQQHGDAAFFLKLHGRFSFTVSV